jgi:hypothetical protein
MGVVDIQRKSRALFVGEETVAKYGSRIEVNL